MARRPKPTANGEGEGVDEATSAFGAVIRRFRQDKGLSLGTVSKMAGISIGALSQIERGIGNPSLKTLTALRVALGADLSDLFRELPPPSEEPSFVTRASERPRLELGYVNKELLSRGSAHNLQFMILNIAPRATSGDKPLSYPAEKGGMVLSGKLIMRVGKEEATVYEGDSFMFDSSVPHSFENPTDEIVRVIWIIGAVHLNQNI